MSIIKDLFTGGIEGIVNSVGNTVDKFVTTDEEKKEAELALRKIDLEFQQLQMDLEEAYIKDRDSARRMYEHDSSLQKIFAIVFLAGYLAISAIMLWLVLSWIPGAEVDIEMPQWAVVLITSVFTAMSTKVNTIVDFLFGGSQGERDARQVQSRFESAAREQ
jgi:hypothetical protein